MKVCWTVAIIGFMLVTMASAGITTTMAGFPVPAPRQAPDTIWLVSSTADSGPGTLREALQSAAAGDTILFDAAIFSPGSPATIALTSGPLPALTQGGLTVDASSAGVILNGSALPSGNGLEIQSAGNVIRGLQIVGFPWHGIQLSPGAHHNIIGGDTAAARNVISANGNDGVHLTGSGTDHNIIAGNYIGLDATGTLSWGNGGQGVIIESGPHYNVVGGDSPGERNIISGNVNNGIQMHTDVMSNTISGNYIGTDAGGTRPLGNGQTAVQVLNDASYNRIGGESAAERNIITYNDGNGVSIAGDNSVGNVIQNNWIGIDADSTGSLYPQALVVAADGTVFLSDLGRGVFRSTDSAASWQAAGSGLDTLNIEILAVSPDYAADQRVWAWGGGVLYASGNGGATWFSLSDALSGAAKAVEASPNYAVDRTLLAAVWHSGLYKSTDGGATWIKTGSQYNASCLAVSPNFATDHVVLIGLDYGGILRSADGGDTWAPSNTGLPGLGVSDLGFAPDGQTVLLASTTCETDRIYRSTDGGQSWSAVAESPNDCGSLQLAVSPDFAAEPVAFVAKEHLYRSLDGGDNWYRTEENKAYGRRAVAIAFSPSFATDRTVYFANFAGVFRTSNGGDLWEWAGANLADRGNFGRGLEVCNGAGATEVLDNVIARNGYQGISVWEAPAEGTLIAGNIFGLAPGGVTRAGNGDVNILLQVPYITIADNTLAAGSVGILSLSNAHHLTIAGNRVGTDASGMAAVGNAYGGINLDSSYDVVRDNLVSGNLSHGISASEGVTTCSHSTITGNLIGVNASGDQPLPNQGMGLRLSGSYHTVGGVAPEDRNVVSANRSCQIYLRLGAHHNTLLGNYVGLNAAGTAAMTNESHGIIIADGAHHNVIGEGNVVSGNLYHGIEIYGVSDNLVQGSYIGTDASGTAIIGNGGQGILLAGGASHNVIGGNNLIAGNSINGVAIDGGGTVFNAITGNSIHDNGVLGIDLTGGGNTELPAPVITVFNLGAGTATGTACAGCTVELFSDDHGEGHWIEATTSADGSGQWAIAKGSPFHGPELTAVATDLAGNSSEFGEDWPAAPPPPPFIAAPYCGVTNQGRPLFSGVAQMGSTVSVWANGLYLGQETTGDWGRWLMSPGETLVDGSHTITATATTAWGTSVPGSLDLDVDTALDYDPVRVTLSQLSVVQHPRNAAGCADPDQILGVALWPSMPVTASVPVRVPTATVYAEVNSVRYDLTDDDGDGNFMGHFSTPETGSLVILLVVDPGTGPQTMQIGSTIDPEGYVYDVKLTASTGITVPVAGAEVTLLMSDTVRHRWVMWDAALYGQINPQVTGEDGHYAFFTPPGTYKLVVDAYALGYRWYESPVLTVVDEPIRVNVPLEPVKRVHLPLVLRQR